MGKVNAIISCILAVLAIAAGVFSFSLFNRRNEFRGRAEILAETLTKVAATMDKDSSTRLAQTVTFTKADPFAQTPESGSLSWKAYNDAKAEENDYAAFAQTMAQIRDLSALFHAQRGELAAHLANFTVILGLPEQQVSTTELQNLANSQTQSRAVAQLVEHVSMVRDRDRAILDALVQLSDTLRIRLDRDSFIQRRQGVDAKQKPILEDYNISMALRDLEDTAKALRQRCESYRDALVQAVTTVNKHNWETRRFHIEDARDYIIAMQTLQSDFAQINEKLILLEKTQAELDNTRNTLEVVTGELQQRREDLGELEAKLATAKRKQEELVNRLRILQPDTDSRTGEPEIIARNRVQGKVLRVDDNWKFIIIDLGYGVVNRGTRLLVARDDECIARIEVSKVLGSISMAEILPDVQQGPIQVGDRVIFPLQEVTQN